MIEKEVKKEELVDLINEICQIDGNLENIQNLVSGGYLDSFNVLILITQLESKFSVSLEFNEDMFDQLDSVEKIYKLVNKF
jgi:acyl carrier protein